MQGQEQTNKLSPLGTFSYTINLDFFSGPLDLLLHLVKQQEVSVDSVQMKDIAEQYLSIVNDAAKYDLERATEYLVIAATLIAIKSKMLLPSESDELNADEDLIEDESFYEELRQRLKTYELTKKRAQALRQMPQFGVDTFTRFDRQALQATPEMFMEEKEDVDSLCLHFMNLVKRVGDAAGSLRIKLEKFSVVNFMMKFVDELKSTKKIGFKSLILKTIQGSNKSLTKKSAVIGSFIAVLELMKRGVVLAEQKDIHSEIEVAYNLNDADLGDLSSEFDDESDSKVVNIEDYRSGAEEEQSKKEVNSGS